MYRIKLQSGDESEFNSFEELCFGVVSGIIGPDDEIYHARAAKWLPINAHPDYKKAAAQAPPTSPAMASQSSAPPSSGPVSHDPPEDEAGQDLMTLLDLEELTAFDPGKVQESAPLHDEAEQGAEPAEPQAPEALEAREPEPAETNGHALHVLLDIDVADEKEADTWDPKSLEPEAKAAEMGSEHADGEVEASLAETEDAARPAAEEASVEAPTEQQIPDREEEEARSDRDQLDDESSSAEMDISKETELDHGEETPVAELEDDWTAHETVAEATDSDVDDIDAAFADTTDATKDIDYVAEEDPDDTPMLAGQGAELDHVEEDFDGDTDDTGDEFDAPIEESAEGSKDIDYIAAEDDDELSMMESVVAEADVSEEDDVEDVEASTDLEDDDADEYAEPEAELAAETGEDDDDDEEDALLGGPVIDVDHSVDVDNSSSTADNESDSDEELVASGVAVDPIDVFQPAVDDDPFRDTFRPMSSLGRPRRFPMLPVAIATGVVVMVGLGWVLMGSGGSDEPAVDSGAQSPSPSATTPAAGSNLNQQSLAAEDPSENVQRRYDEAYVQARERLNADLRRAGFASVFASANFANRRSMTSARATIAGAGQAVTAYADRERAIAEEFPDADPTGRESRAHRELAEDLLTVSRGIYDVLLANVGAFALRKGAMTITKPAVEAEYQRLFGELNRLMALAATADEEQAATVRNVSAAIGATRPPALAELAPPPRLPSDL